MNLKLHMLGAAFSAILFASSASAAERVGIPAWRVGIPACDEMLYKYETCLRSRLPEQWSAYEKDGKFGRQVKAYAAALAKDKKARAKADKACKGELEALEQYGGNADCFLSPLALFGMAFMDLKEPKAP